MKLRLEKIIGLLAEFTILAVVFFAPLYFALFFITNDVFELNKIALFKILTLSLFFLTGLRLAFTGTKAGGSLAFLKEDKLLPAVFLAVFLLLFSLALATFFSVNRGISISGLYTRWQGLISNFYYVLFFILLVINVRTKEQVLRIVKAIVFSSFFVSLYGLAQAAGYDPRPWAESSRLRAFSTMGQPNFLAMYLLLVSPMSIYFIKRSSAPFKGAELLLAFFVLLANLACLFFTYSLSGWVGLIGGTFVAIIAFLFWFISRDAPIFYRTLVWVKSALAARGREVKESEPGLKAGRIHPIIILGIMAIMAASVFAIAKVQNKRVFDARLTSLVNFQSASLTSRYNWWRASQQAILNDGGVKRLLFGYGPETQSEVLVKYYQKDWGVYENVNVRPDRAHNLFLDILLTTGFVGLIAHLSLLALFFYLLFKIIKKSPEFKWLGFCLLLALISYLLALQLNFTFVVGEIYFWLYLAIILVIAKLPERFRKAEAIPNQDAMPAGLLCQPSRKFSGGLFCNDSNLPRFIIKLFTVFGIGVLIFWQINNQIKLLAVDHYFRELREARASNQYFGALAMHEFIKEKAPANRFYDRQFAIIMSGWIEEFSDQRFKKFGAEKLALSLDSLGVKNYDDLYAKAIIFKALADDKNPQYFADAENEFKKLILISPEMPSNYIELAGLYAKWGKSGEAVETYMLAADKLPDLNHPEINADHKRAAEALFYNIYLSIGDIYLKENDFNTAEDYYKRAVGLNKKIINGYGKLAELKLARGDFETAIWYNEMAMEMDKENYQWPQAIGRIYEKIGEKEKAEEYFKKAQGLLPDNLLIK